MRPKKPRRGVASVTICLRSIMVPSYVGGDILARRWARLSRLPLADYDLTGANGYIRIGTAVALRSTSPRIFESRVRAASIAPGEFAANKENISEFSGFWIIFGRFGHLRCHFTSRFQWVKCRFADRSRNSESFLR